MTSPSPPQPPSSYVEKPSPSPSDPPPDPTAPAGNGKMLGQYYPGLAESCRRAYRLTIDAMREAAQARGYCLAVHGSLARDIDLVAVPWRADAVSAAELAAAVHEAAKGAIPGGLCWGRAEDPVKKPHGRLAWSFYFVTGAYIDLSVTPRAVSP